MMEAERSEILSSKSETKSNAPNFRVCLPRFEFRDSDFSRLRGDKLGPAKAGPGMTERGLPVVRFLAGSRNKS